MAPPPSRGPRILAGGKSPNEPQAAISDYEDLQDAENEQDTPGEGPEPGGHIMYGSQEQPDEQDDEAASGLAAAKILSRSELDGRAAATQRLGKRNVSNADVSVTGASSASLQATYGPGADWSQSFQGTTGRGNLTETPTPAREGPVGARNDSLGNGAPNALWGMRRRQREP